jgi:hypothetical protein
MVGISDAIVIGCVLGLVFAAVSYYLYSRTVQLEKKVGLMENILLDLKVTTEQALMMEVQDTHGGHGGQDEQDEQHEQHQQHQPQEQDEQNGETELSSEDVREISVDSPRSRTPSASPTLSVTREETQQQQSVSVNYEANTYKELLQVAKQKGVTGGSHMTKSELIAAIRRRDSGQPLKEIPAAWASLLEVAGNQVAVKKEEEAVQEVEAADDSGNDHGAALDDDEVDSSFVQ